MKWLDVLKVIGPAVLMMIPGAQPYAPLVVAVIHLAEEAGGTGVDKKQIAKDAMPLLAQAANTAAKTTIVDPVAAVSVADDTIDAVVAVVNLVHAAVAAKQAPAA